MNEASRDNIESIWWRDLKLALQHPQHGHALQSAISWRVGRGDKIKFWEDNWLDSEGSLLTKYPRLFIISCQQNKLIQQMGFQQDSGWVWDFRWRRSLFDSEIHMAVSFLEDIEGKSIQPHTADQWLWTADPTGHYSVKSAYKMMLAESAEESHDSTRQKLICSGDI